VSTVLITGSAGLIGSEAARHFHHLGFDVIGIDNDMRAAFFGPEASTAWMSERLSDELPRYRHVSEDIRNGDAVARIVQEARGLELIIHTAAQPSHDWAARDPVTDFGINALGTLNVLEAVRHHAPDATVIFTSTNKVYGDTPNRLPLVELELRYELAEGHPWFNGIPTAMSIDRSTHSLFGVSKAAADLMVQEYGLYFDLRTVSFRAGCLTGPSHSGAELHGFLAYLMKCVVTGRPYTVYGYNGKQVRDNIHSGDLVAAFECVANRPQSGGVYNIGGGRACNCSMLEAIAMCERIAGGELSYDYTDRHRVGDHIWWVSDLSEFQADYPDWTPRYDVESMLTEIFELNRDRWLEKAGSKH
jgi:CDP-paratose 2-epimerase